MQDVVVTVNTGPGLHVAFVHIGKAVSENELFLIKNHTFTHEKQEKVTHTGICRHN